MLAANRADCLAGSAGGLQRSVVCLQQAVADWFGLAAWQHCYGLAACATPWQRSRAMSNELMVAWQCCCLLARGHGVCCVHGSCSVFGRNSLVVGAAAMQ
jgi:hypothetical protein